MTRYFSMPEETLRLPASEFKTYAVLRRMAECPAVDSLSREAEAVGLDLPLPLSAQGEAVGLTMPLLLAGLCVATSARLCLAAWRDWLCGGLACPRRCPVH